MRAEDTSAEHDAPVILMLSPDNPLEAGSGLGTHVFELAMGLASSGCQVTVLAYTPYKPGVFRRGNVDFHLVSLAEEGVRAFDQQWFFDVTMLLTSYGERLLADQRCRPDLLHCHDWLTFAAARNLRERYNIPVVGSVHLCQSAREKWEDPLETTVELHSTLISQERAMCQYADGLITVSYSMRALLSEICDVPREQIVVVYNGIDSCTLGNGQLPTEEKRSLRARYASDDEPIVLFVGRLERRKGILPFLEAALEVLKEMSEVHYLVVGGPAMNEPVRGFREILQLRRQYPSAWKQIKLEGRVSREKLTALYQIADCVVVPSLYEPFGLVAAEAMSMGAPVIATAVGGLQEIIQHGQTGELVPVQTLSDGLNVVDVPALVSAQLRLLKDRRLAAMLGEAGKRSIRSTFTRERMVHATRAVYQQVVERMRNKNLAKAQRNTII